MHRLGYYGLASLFVAAAVALRWALPEVLGPTPFLVFYLAWVGAAAFGGLGPGLLATAASWLCLEELFNFTPGQTIFSDPTEVGRFLVLLAGGLTVSLVAERMRRGRIHERQQAEELRTANEELRESELALHNTEERLRLAMESGKVGVWEWEANTKEAKWSQGIYMLLGCKPGEVPPTQEAFRRRIHPQDLARQDQTLKDSLERCEDYLCEFRVVWADGSVHWVEARGQYAYVDEGSGTILRMRGVLSDIDRRKQAEEVIQQAHEQLQQQTEELQTQGEELQTQTEELRMQTEELAHANAALRESEERERQRAEELATFLDAAPTPVIIVHDPSGAHMTGNRAADELLRHPRGTEISLSAPPETRPRHFKAVKDGRELRLDELPAQRAARGEEVRDFEFNLVFDDGTTRHLLGYGTPLRDKDGRPGGAVHILVDITERKRAEEALRETRDYLDNLFNYANAPIIVWNPEFKITRFNAAFERLSGRTAQEVLGREIDVLFPPESREESLAHIRRTTSEKRHWEVLEIPILHRNGSVRTVLWNSANVLASDNETVIATIAQGQDITERKQAEEALRELNATLESKVAQRTAQLQWRARQLQKLTLEVSQAEDRERKRMAEILHDDLQQIMAGAKFHLSLLRNRVKYDASLQAIAAQIDGMLKDAIEKSRGLSHELSPAILYQGDFTETLGWLAGQMQAKHGLVVHVHAHGPAHVSSDTVRTFLYKTAQELLFNVVKHARVQEAGIRVRRCGPCVCLSVSDRGRGFDPQELRETAGFGLLSIRERIELLGGRMRIKSAKGKGSTFFIVVPEGEQVVVPPLSGVTATQPGVAGPQAQNRLRVLLADDHRIVRQGLRSLLSDERDVEIVGEAAHGREAVDLALRLEPDVVIMDVAMPLIDGNQATRQIKEHLPKIRVIALSTYNEPETMEKMYQAGAESYVLKTASSEELLAAIRGKKSGPQ
jgi:PAS domain S-box-containing protein